MKSKVAKVPQLTPEELAEFRIRRVAADQARALHAMVMESYQRWVAEVLRHHHLRGRYDIDVATGILRPREEAD